MAEFKPNVPIESTKPTISVTFSATSPPLKIGRHTFRLDVEDNSGNRSTKPDELIVFVMEKDAPTARISGPTQVLFGQAFELSGEKSTDVGGGQIVKWIFTLVEGQL